MAVLLSEDFNDATLTGWEDDTGDVWIDTSTMQSGAGSWRIQYDSEATNCRNSAGDGTVVSIRYSFTSSDQLYVRFWWRFNSDWVGSGQTYHPHLFFVLDELWANLAGGPLRVYVEVSALLLRFIVGRGGVEDWRDTTYEFTQGNWSKVELWMQMNTVGQSDGILSAWVDGTSVFSASDMTYRTSADYHYGAIAVAPWIGDGSPQSQRMWMDELLVATKIPVLENTSSINGYSCGVSSKFLGTNIIGLSKIMGN
jgi:hypothetical protein